MSESVETLFSEVEKNGELWRASYSDLPVTLLILSRVKRALGKMPEGAKALEVWAGLKGRGELFARRRALFVAAEAVGHLPSDMKALESEKIREELGVVINEGTSLHKVRALRAMSFIASNECVPFLKKGLQDESPWVQATALHTLFRLNLRHREPRKVLTDFLLDTFRQNIKPEHISAEALGKNFFLHKGLFVGLLKEPGGKGLAALALLLWAASVLAVTGMALGAFVGGLAALALGLAAIAVVLPPTILATPLWARSIWKPGTAMRVRSVCWALLDYVLISLMVVTALSEGYFYPGIALAVFWFLLAVSAPANGSHRQSAERFRSFVRCLFTAALGWFAYRTGQDGRLTAGIILFAAAQFAWMLPWFGPRLISILDETITGVVVVADALWRLSKWLPRALARAMPRLARGLGRALRAARPRPEHAGVIRERLSGPFGSIKSGVEEKIRSGLRPRPKHVLIGAAVIGALVGAVYGLRKLANFTPSDEFRQSMGPLVRSLPFTLKPYAYVVFGVLLLLICSGGVLLLFHILWDELLIVERIRFRILSKRRSHPDSAQGFLAYIFQTVRDETLSTGLRVQAVSALAQFTESNPAYLNQLLDLAEEDLPPRVRDAIYQTVDAAEKRIQRGQSDASDVDVGLINQQVENLSESRAGSILRPKLFKGLTALLAGSLLAGAAQLYAYLGGGSLTDALALAELALGGGLLGYFLSTGGGASEFRKWSLVTGVILLVVALTHPLQDFLLAATRPDISLTFGLAFIDAATLRALFVPTVLAGLAAQMAHTLYLLDSNTRIPLKTEGKSNAFQRRVKRLENQPVVWYGALKIAVVVASLQSAPLQELVELRKESMPFFAPNGNDLEVELRGIPTDGRVVRVALVSVEKPLELPFDGMLPNAYDAAVARLDEAAYPYTPSVERTFPPVFVDGGHVRNDPEDIDDPIYGGEIWLAAERGEIKVWQTIPDGCLTPDGLNGDTMTFAPHSVCNYDLKTRLVAIVYNKKRSAAVKRRARRENALREFQQAESPRHRLLLDTLSPFARVVWSPVL